MCFDAALAAAHGVRRFPDVHAFPCAQQKGLLLAQRPHPAASRWLKAGAFAVLLITVINGWMLFSTPDVQQLNTDVLEMVIANEDFELLQDLDFVAWMIEEDHAG